MDRTRGELALIQTGTDGPAFEVGLDDGQKVEGDNPLERSRECPMEILECLLGRDRLDDLGHGLRMVPDTLGTPVHLTHRCRLRAAMKP